MTALLWIISSAFYANFAYGFGKHCITVAILYIPTVLCVILTCTCSFYIVDLQQTSSPSVCPGDDFILTCRITISAGHFLSLTWCNPNNSQEQFTYSFSNTATHNTTGCVAGFIVKLIGIDELSLVSTATLREVTSDEDGKKIKCRFSDTHATSKIKLSGKFKHSF